VDAGEKPAKVLDDLGIKKYCCRTVFLTQRDVLTKVAKFRI
jgi:DNA-directed RNA polymerase subunit N